MTKVECPGHMVALVWEAGGSRSVFGQGVGVGQAVWTLLVSWMTHCVIWLPTGLVIELKKSECKCLTFQMEFASIVHK